MYKNIFIIYSNILILYIQSSNEYDITYGHSLHNNQMLIEHDIDDANETDTNQNPGNSNGKENNRDNGPAANNPKSIELDDEAFEPQLENEYLQGWAEMLKEEK